MTIIKYSKLLKYTEQCLAGRTSAPSNGCQRADPASAVSPRKCRDQKRRQEQEQEQEPSQTMAIEERGQSFTTSHLYLELDVHYMEYSCFLAWVSCSGSAPPCCYLSPAAGQLESLSSCQQPRCQWILTFFSYQFTNSRKPLEENINFIPGRYLIILELNLEQQAMLATKKKNWLTEDYLNSAKPAQPHKLIWKFCNCY